MKKLLFFVFMILGVCGYAQREGDYDASIHAKEILEVDADSVIVRDTSTFPLDMSYIRWSADGITFRKNYVLNDTWIEHSNTSKTSFDTIRFALNLWEVNGDTITPIDDKILYNDTVVGDVVTSLIYFLGTDTLSLTNMYSGDGIDGYTLIRSGDTAIWQPLPSGVGASYGRNVNTYGIGVYQDTLGSELQFRGIYNTDGFIDLSLADSTITLEWDGSGRNVSAGIGLNGAGDLGSDITINLYIPELLELTSVSSFNDWVAIYDQSASQHKKVNPYLFYPSIYVNNTETRANAPIFDFSEGNNVSIEGDVNGTVTISADDQSVDLYIDSVLSEEGISQLNLIAGENITLTDLGDGNVRVTSTGGGGSLPTCDEGEFLAVVGGEWACVNVCDFICSDTIINIINNYNDTVPSVIAPSGDVTINFSRLDCEDSTQILATTLASSTTNLTTIKIATVPTVGELHYNGVLVTAGQELSVTLGSLDTVLYYVSDASTGSSYADLFTFQLLYSSNASYLGAANVNVSVDACVTESVCFGYLYNWYVVDDSRELTSSADWSVPELGQMYDLRDYVGSGTTAGKFLKADNNVYWNPNTGTNDYGFSAVGSGYRLVDGGFDGIRTFFRCWSTYFLFSVMEIQAGSDTWTVNTIGDEKLGASIRLVKDATGLADGVTTTYTGNDGKVYNAIVINELYWTTENLEETQYRDGSSIPNVTDNTTWAGLTTGALCLYDNDANNACQLPLPESGWDITQEYCNDSYVFGLSGLSGHQFNEDGTKLFVKCYTTTPYSPSIVEYSLSSAYDVTTLATVDTATIYGLSPSSSLSGLHIDPSGTYAFTVENGGGGYDEYITRYTIATPWDLSGGITQTDQLNITPSSKSDRTTYGISFDTDGDKMFLVDHVTDSLYQYALSTPWMVSTASESQRIDISAYGNVFGIHFKEDGSRVYLIDSVTKTVYELQLSTPFDISTASALVSSIKTYANTASDISISIDGKYLFISGYNNEIIYKICLTP